jgi:hypothetical protein
VEKAGEEARQAGHERAKMGEQEAEEEAGRSERRLGLR